MQQTTTKGKQSEDFVDLLAQWKVGGKGTERFREKRIIEKDHSFFSKSANANHHHNKSESNNSFSMATANETADKPSFAHSLSKVERQKRVFLSKSVQLKGVTNSPAFL
jgi:hypothetical protein